MPPVFPGDPGPPRSLRNPSHDARATLRFWRAVGSIERRSLPVDAIHEEESLPIHITTFAERSPACNRGRVRGSRTANG
jgi:hypothetical protein